MRAGSACGVGHARGRIRWAGDGEMNFGIGKDGGRKEEDG
jgi:hypothetical protein